jgi:phosphoglycerol transferase MdoB-like AlkP superfamily enzyme
MQSFKTLAFLLMKLLFFWVVLFDVQRILFSIHNWDKFAEVSFSEWLLAFVYSIRLDLSTAALLSLPLMVALIIFHLIQSRWALLFFKVIFLIEILLVVFIHSGEINAYQEWNHKLTTRVFTHLMNPDEVFRTADGGMTVFFIFFSILELLAAYVLFRWLFKSVEVKNRLTWYLRFPLAVVQIAVFGAALIVLGRGGFQQIPINTDAAYYTRNYAANDLSVNSFYFFTKSFLLYNRTSDGAKFPVIPEKEAKTILSDFVTYDREHDVRILKNERPNVVFIVLESWTANAVGTITGKPGATPNFDRLSEEGLLFTNIYATGSTSEVGNSSIFSGYPALPEIFISMQADKHRKIPSINQDMKEWGYSSHYLFSGDLKYGNIGGYFTDHGFDVVHDETNFPDGLKRGKLNYFDEDLYKEFKRRINATKEPFLHCAFTGSTHSPYDFPERGTPRWKGKEKKFMNSVFYADACLRDFIESCKNEKWYKNTLFVLVADHGHASPAVQNPSLAGFFHIPLLIFGEPLKKEFRGKRIDQIGSQADIAATLIKQMKGDAARYKWSKDLLNPNVPEFALFALSRGYGWVTPNGNFSYNMDGYGFLDQTMTEPDLKMERKRCHSFMSLVYQEFLSL